MKSGLKPLIAFAIGIVAVGLLVYFYISQRQLEARYKAVQEAFFELDSHYRRLNYEVLRTSLFAYVNQDVIVQELHALDAAYNRLLHAKIWQRAGYRSNKREVDALNGALEKYAMRIQDFMMLNAGIKNSFVFIVSLPTKHMFEFKRQPRLYEEILAIVAQLSQARMLADAGFLDEVLVRLHRLERFRSDSQQSRQLIANFKLHVKYLLDHYPHFITMVSTIGSSSFKGRMETAEKHFMMKVRNDFGMLERFAAVLLVMFVLSVISIIGLLIRTERENRRLKRLEAELRFALTNDTLTGLYNRRQFETLLPSFDSPVLLLLNIDHFKHINDFYGMSVGDAILKHFAHLIQRYVGYIDAATIFRLGGDDFGIVLQRSTLHEAQRLARTFKTKIEDYVFKVDSVDVYLTVTVAINMTQPLLENADLALQREKMRKRGDVVVFTEAERLKERVRQNLQVMQTVKSALDRNALEAWFQPIVQLRDGRVVKYEALVRIVHEDGTVEGPQHFLQTICKTPYYRQITQVMVEQVFTKMAKRHERFSINLSMSDLTDEKLCTMLFDLIDRHRETASRLDIELLESEELDDLPAVRAFLERVKGYGCKIAIDDFGSGYSNFAYILELPIDILKIDGSLVGQIREDEQKYLAVRTIAAFAKEMHLEVVAEFVEDAETAAILRDFGVTMAQGYHFGRPSPNF